MTDRTDKGINYSEVGINITYGSQIINDQGGLVSENYKFDSCIQPQSRASIVTLHAIDYHRMIHICLFVFFIYFIK